VNSVLSEPFDDECVDPPLIPIFGDELRPLLAARYSVVAGTGELDLGLCLRDLGVFVKKGLDV
jgi:hypothetical protein